MKPTPETVITENGMPFIRIPFLSITVRRQTDQSARHEENGMLPYMEHPVFRSIVTR
ncbi:hypothetical protein M493_09440 [Geobacillus genomosp. 3]|uniref:Uncharacterized protein n=1 Tax=Geobacillus genomosp. 3 TaxID=1921421 RepID=S5ZD49_GEOG3|nr:hypothetical protein [Geobacillus genomosp. 3]AGT32150.1 hypothetical protein M493_09440 [Geobacillus genomosp. 3]